MCSCRREQPGWWRCSCSFCLCRRRRAGWAGSCASSLSSCLGAPPDAEQHTRSLHLIAGKNKTFGEFVPRTYSGADGAIHRQPVFEPLDHRGRFGPPRHAAQVVGLPSDQQHLWTPVDHRVIWGDWRWKRAKGQKRTQGVGGFLGPWSVAAPTYSGR